MNRLPLILLLATAHSAFAAAPASSKESTEKDVKTAAASTPSAASLALVTPAKAASADQAHFDQFPPVATEATIQFPRQMMCKLDRDNTWFVEGYWRSKKDDDPSTLTGNAAIVAQYPFPVAHAQPWPGKDDFVAKMWIIEHHSKSFWKKKIGLRTDYSKGYSPSRLTGEDVGSAQFHDYDFNVTWPTGFVQHYIDRHNIIPSLHFYRYAHARAAQFGAKTNADTQRIKAEMIAAEETQKKAAATAEWNNETKRKEVIASFISICNANTPNSKNIDAEFGNKYPQVIGDNVCEWRSALIGDINRACYRFPGSYCPPLDLAQLLDKLAFKKFDERDK